MSVVIRPIRLEDASGYRDALGQVAAERVYILLLETPPLEQAEAFVKNNIENGNAHFIALNNQEVVGWADCVALTRKGTEHVGRLGMGIINGYRRQGIGSRLLNKTLSHAWKQGLTRVELEVYADNEPAIHLYKKAGFKLEGVRKYARLLDGVYQDIFMMAQYRVT